MISLTVWYWTVFRVKIWYFILILGQKIPSAVNIDLFLTIKALNCMILVSYWRFCSLWLFDISNNVVHVLGYFTLIFGQKPFLTVVKFPFFGKKNQCFRSFFTIMALYYMILVSYWRLSFLSRTVVRVLELQNVHNPLLSYPRPVVSKKQAGVTINLSLDYGKFLLRLIGSAMFVATFNPVTSVGVPTFLEH